MKTILKILKWLLLAIVSIIVCFVLFVYTRANRTYDAPYPEIATSQDSALIARGKYLVYGPAHCAHCHAPTSEFGKVEAGEEISLSGGFNFVIPIGTIFAPNITTDEETGIGKFTDGELARALRFGVKRNGQALFDFMPFYDLSDNDLTAIISYLRTTSPVKNQRPQNDFNFIGNTVRALGAIKPMGDAEFSPPMQEDSTALYGKYIAQSVANCMGCHTNRDLQTGGWIGEFYAGGFPMEMIDENGKTTREKHVVTPNLTPDPTTGRITTWTEADFIQRFRGGRVIPGSPMPWGPFSKMTETELKAIYRYLITLDPVESAAPLGVQDGPPPGW